MRDLLWAKAYIDDILDYADSHEQMRQRLHILFKELQEYNVKVNINK